MTESQQEWKQIGLHFGMWRREPPECDLVRTSSHRKGMSQ